MSYTITAALALAQDHLQAGRWTHAGEICRSVIAADAECDEAWRLLGQATFFSGDKVLAQRCFERALSLNPQRALTLQNQSVLLRALQRYEEAEAAARQALLLDPGLSDAHAALGEALRRQRRWNEAEAAYRTALSRNPQLVDAYHGLIHILVVGKRFAEAESACRQALAYAPESAPLWQSLGRVQQQQQRWPEAEAAFRRAVQLNPRWADGYVSLGQVLHGQGRDGEAEATFRQALQLSPERSEGYAGLGAVLHGQMRIVEAEAAYRQALRWHPDNVDCWSNLVAVLRLQNRMEEAQAAGRRALELAPDSSRVWSKLADLYLAETALEAAEAAARRAIELDPLNAEAHNTLGTIVCHQGAPEEALSLHHRAVELEPTCRPAACNALFTMQYCDGVSLEKLADAHARFVQASSGSAAVAAARPIDRDPERPLRIGFVSGDLRTHPVGRFSVPLIEHLDRRQFHLYYYSSLHQSDALTERVRATASGWRDIHVISTQAVVDRIVADQIDILIDLSGHTGGNRMDVFACKPAPVQMTWIGYEGTTGVRAIDYLIADRFTVRPEDEPFYVERILRLPDSYICFDPPAEAPAVNDLPARAAGAVTLGCLNSPAKFSASVIALWAEVLRRLPGSRLLLKYLQLDRPAVVERLRSKFAAAGADVERIEFRGWTTGFAAALATYHEIDVALDPFPFSGGATTCDALWMGVPVLTLPGATFAGRHTLSYLSAVGLEECVATDRADYVERVAALAGDVDRLAEVRSTLRSRMAVSPLCDAQRFAHNWSVLIRDAWRAWCQGAAPSVAATRAFT